MNTQTHTPTPWETDYRGHIVGSAPRQPTLAFMVSGNDNEKADAAYIVRSVNAYETNERYIEYVRLMVKAKAIVLTFEDWKNSFRQLQAIARAEANQ